MRPEEFTAFADAKPAKNKHIIVTNNLQAKNAHGEMSHVWMTTFWDKGSEKHEGIVTFDSSHQKIIGLSHWKYA
mgnify:CR=1 FL=1